MTLAEVEQRLGAPGLSQSEGQLPGVVDWSVPVDHPKRVKAVIGGEESYRWNKSGSRQILIGDAYIIISLRDGVVADKYYWEPSLRAGACQSADAWAISCAAVPADASPQARTATSSCWRAEGIRFLSWIVRSNAFGVGTR
jgi:hypothetical protein